MKKAFTLLEVVISITIFMIILTLLYKVLDDTKVVNKNIEKYLKEDKNKNRFYKILVEDIAESAGEITIIKDKNERYFITFKSYNTYHNPFFTYITYLLSKDNAFLRIESKFQFKEQLNEEFFDTAYIDILKKDIKEFKVFKNSDKVLFSFITKENKKELFSVLKMKD